MSFVEGFEVLLESIIIRVGKDKDLGLEMKKWNKVGYIRKC